ncbi:MAG: glycogen/starch/alpha-glucan family phosphorylase [Nitrospinaceae bacterium]|nr:glycogen/starch/alpha-glucan phosphorylase [Nitrospinaceae bacterium]NIR55318.1 glycogen/starch/alpha-glucan phosphorylase [Nitrospinaceae bacterium]NIS85757.1 glycogen/starch/alpha-glucan phosphorylase [Nitrospinaceae bacterium]NIT82607.1 glycogen/starch/alpha-glucan phosphorylase [Nitrospinaceae bacterium]NIU44812.1 glycogen/starch/alpha-glucan phosphorylase [Nitrospinaceae bacterium]
MLDSSNSVKPSHINRGNEAENLKHSIGYHLKYSQAKDWQSATVLDKYNSVALAVRDRLVERWIQTQNEYYENDPKRIYYLSMEYLVGRALGNYLVNLDFRGELYQALKQLGIRLEEMEVNDIEAGLGNGGLGRLAACFLDSMATLGLPAYGYGIRYEFGIFYQKIVEGYQVETADNWLRRGNPWEIPRPDYMYPVKFYGTTRHGLDKEGRPVAEWVDTHDDVMAMAYDIPIPGYHSATVNNLRLWGARSTRNFDLNIFNEGDYVQAVSRKQESETISKVLYPNDQNMWGKELRLKQEYFFVSASLQDIIRRYKRTHVTYGKFSDKVAIQLNDAHPALAIPELMRILVDEERRPWEEAWGISEKTFAFTNHTVLPEALEKWNVDLLGRVLPRHLEIIYEINHRFLKRVGTSAGRDNAGLEKLSLVEEKPVKSIRMTNLAIVGSHAVNGVAALHTDILKNRVFNDFYRLYPDRFHNITNGITQRLWLKSCNPGLAKLITETIGDGWITHLDLLRQLLPHMKDETFRQRWREIKLENKVRLAQFVQEELNISLNPESLFDVQIKRIHEYKRQLLCALYAVAQYNRIKEHPSMNVVPRSIIFAGKAAPGYEMAKLVIKLINNIAEKINGDQDIEGKLKVVFIPNYNVTKAECIIPGADLSEQISTAGHEASGTGNMKLALNGALTIGTLDGANVEIREKVGKDNIFIFGWTTQQVEKSRSHGYRPRDYYENNEELKQAVDMIREGYFCPDHPHIFQPIIDSLLVHGDPYRVMADFEDYLKTQEKVEQLYQDKDAWTRKSIINSANMGWFSSDRSIQEYCRLIWKVPTQKSL